MSIQAVFNGVSYSLPQKGEVGWFDLTDYLYALSGAATTSSMIYSVVNVTGASYTISSTDMAMLVNFAGASTLTLPAGTDGRFILVVDKSNAAQTNNITIVPDGLQTINGTTEYVIKSNNGAVLLAFDNSNSNWFIVSEVTVMDYIVTVNHLATESISLPIDSHQIAVMDDSRKAIILTSEYFSDKISCIADKNDLFLTATGYTITKAANSNTISITNNTGNTRTLAIRRL